jgi:hypothetical protein
MLNAMLRSLATYIATVALVTGEQHQENNKGKTMETSTGELIAKLTNLSHNLALELRFKESSLVLEAVGALHMLPNIAETIRNEWHPSMNDSGPSKGLSYISSAQLVDADE